MGKKMYSFKFDKIETIGYNTLVTQEDNDAYNKLASHINILQIRECKDIFMDADHKTVSTNIPLQLSHFK